MATTHVPQGHDEVPDPGRPGPSPSPPNLSGPDNPTVMPLETSTHRDGSAGPDDPTPMPGKTMIYGDGPAARPPGAGKPLLAQQLGPYRIVGFLGRGGMALVYEALDEQGRSVALKIMEETPFTPASMLARFRREAEATKRLRKHPNIITVYDTGQVGATHYIAMELVPGGRSLEALLDSFRRAPPLSSVLKIGVAIGSALAYAHAEGVIHRDIKPGNILLNPDNVPLLADFGLARWENSDEPSLTMTAATLGTPRYMAPEQGEGAKNAGPLSDQYSLGCVLYELAVGQLPYELNEGMGLAEILRTITHTPPRNPRKLARGVTRDYAAILLKCLEKDPRDRYPDVLHLVNDLKACQAGTRVSVHIPSVFERCDRLVRRHKLVAAGVVLCIGGGLVAWHMHEQRLDAERGKLWVPRARALSNQLELEALRGELAGAQAGLPEEEALLSRARQVLTDDRDPEEAVRLLSRLLDGKDPLTVSLEDEGPRSAVWELARVQLAVGNVERAESLFLRVAKACDAQLLRMAGTRGSLIPSPRGAYARFEAGLACLLGNDLDRARIHWRRAVLDLPPGTPAASMCRAGIGEITPRELSRLVKGRSDVSTPLALWLAARLTDDANDRGTWHRKAVERVNDAVPWLYYRLTSPPAPVTRQETEP